MEFCDNIKKIRDNNGLTQAQFASKLGLSTPTVAAWENGSKKPSFDVLIQIAKIFNVSLDWLCGISKLDNIKIETWADIIKLIAALLSYEHLDVHAKIDKAVGTISFDRYLCDPSVFPAEAHCPTNKYAVIDSFIGGLPIDEECPSDIELLTFTNPIYQFIQEYQKMKALLSMDNDYSEIYNLWLEKQFEKYDNMIWHNQNNQSIYVPDLKEVETDGKHN